MTNKAIFQKIPAWLKVSSYFLIIIAAAYLASRVPALDSVFFYFGISLTLSYLMLRADDKSLFSLGFKPVGNKDWKYFFGGIGLGLSALSLTAGITIWLNHGRLVFIGNIDPIYLFILILIHLWSSFAQEFTYRGYPFQHLLKAYGPWTAQLFITVPFAVMHLNLNAPVKLDQFLILLLTTGLGSILYGLCYIKTGKLLLSIGLHMGWNLMQAILPRSPDESRTKLFQLVQEEHSYQPLNILLPYIGVTTILIICIWRTKPALPGA